MQKKKKLNVTEQADVLYLERMRNDLVAYTVAAIPGRYGKPWTPAWFHLETCEAMQRLARGEINRLFVKFPPQHGKSTLGNVAFPSWYLGRNPDHNIISCTYGYDLVRRFSNQTRDTIKSIMYQKIFPWVSVAQGENRMEEWRLTNGGGYRAAGIGGGVSGFPADLLILDDMFKSWEDARSEAKQEEAWSFYTTVALPRVPSGKVLMIGTAYNELDVMHQAIKHAEKDPAARYEVITYPARSDDGAYLWPEVYSEEFYKEVETLAGPTRWNCVYQQDPCPSEGNIFKAAWWQHYNGYRPTFKRIVQAWDTAFSEKTTADYSVCATFGETETDKWLLDVYRARIDFPELERKAKELYTKYNPNIVIVEEKASGISLIQSLRRGTGLPVRGVPAERDKVARAQAVTGQVEAGRVKLPSSAPWLSDFLREITAFPNGTHDDQVDAFVHGLTYMIQRRGVRVT